MIKEMRQLLQKKNVKFFPDKKHKDMTKMDKSLTHSPLFMQKTRPETINITKLLEGLNEESMQNPQHLACIE